MTSLRFLPEQIEQWPVARLKPYAKNARTHTDDQIAKAPPRWSSTAGRRR